MKKIINDKKILTLIISSIFASIGLIIILFNTIKIAKKLSPSTYEYLSFIKQTKDAEEQLKDLQIETETEMKKVEKRNAAYSYDFQIDDKVNCFDNISIDKNNPIECVMNLSFPLRPYDPKDIDIINGDLTREDIYRNFVENSKAYNRSIIEHTLSNESMDYDIYTLQADNLDCTDAIYCVEVIIPKKLGIVGYLNIYTNDDNNEQYKIWINE